MVTVKILCTGKLKEAYWRDACAEYAKRLAPFCKFLIEEFPESRLPDNPSALQIEAALQEEGVRILAAAHGSALIALCIEGKMLSSEEYAARIQKFMLEGTSTICLAIGSSFGLSAEVKQAAALRFSMAPMTFPHQLARVMLCEQTYRAFQILNHGKYHK